MGVTDRSPVQHFSFMRNQRKRSITLEDSGVRPLYIIITFSVLRMNDNLRRQRTNHESGDCLQANGSDRLKQIHTHPYTHTQLREKKNTVDSSGLWQRSFRKSRVFGIDWNEAKAFNAFSEWCIVLSSLWQFQTRLLRFVISLQTLPSINNHIYGKLIWGK